MGSTRISGRNLHALVVSMVLAAMGSAELPDSRREETDAVTCRALGRALYENEDFDRAAEQFRRCVEIAPDSALDHLNLAIVLLRAERYDELSAALEVAAALDRELLGVDYLRGIMLIRLRKYERAAETLSTLVSEDPNSFAAWYHLGLCHKYLDRKEQAIVAFERTVQMAFEHPSAHYQLMILYRLAGDVQHAERHKEVFQRTRDNFDASELTSSALERSKYTDIREPCPFWHRLPADPQAEFHFVDATARAGLPVPPRVQESTNDSAQAALDKPSTVDHGAVSFLDCDADGDLDLYVARAHSAAGRHVNKLYRNDGLGRFVDVTEGAGMDKGSDTRSIAFGDYDNDGFSDVYLVNRGPNVLFHNQGNCAFEDISALSHVDDPQDGLRALFFDYDHDYDLDLFIANAGGVTQPDAPPSNDTGPASQCGFNTLLRSNGDGTFTDQTDEAGLLVACSQTCDALFADFDADYDVDLLVVSLDQPARLFLNQRMGKFAIGGSFSPPIEGQVTAAAEGDFDGNGTPDLLLARGTQLYLYTNGGLADFKGKPVAAGERPMKSLAVADFNNDGWFDVLITTADGAAPMLLVATGPAEFREVSARVGLEISAPVTSAASGDVDHDGDIDVTLLTGSGPVVLLRNDPSGRANYLDVRLIGKKVNRSAYGATVELLGPGLRQRVVSRAGNLHFGLGRLKQVDVVRVVWPSGVAQNVIRPPINGLLTIEEQVRVSASCGFLFAFNGSCFELVNEVLGVGALGVPVAPNVYHVPDSTELIKISGTQLSAVDGEYHLRLTEELRETMYVDAIRLRVVDHPAELEIIPNEMFRGPPFPEDRFFAVAEASPLASAITQDGEEIGELLKRKDGRFPTFPMTKYDGIARRHSLVLDLGDLSSAERIILFLEGWIYWPDSSTVMAVAQNPRYEILPPSLAVRDESGNWHTVVQAVGLPTSKGLTVPVDLTGRFPANDFSVRLSSNMCLYLDRVFVGTRDLAERCQVRELTATHAELRERGFSRMHRDRYGYERFEYSAVSRTGPWRPKPGKYTAYGDVLRLLEAPDDMYVILGPGDEIALRFSAERLPVLLPGWTRDFIFVAHGWVKDGDLNTKSSESVEPLPFRGMSGYPYPRSQIAQEDSNVSRVRSEYNTRTVDRHPGSPRQPP